MGFSNRNFPSGKQLTGQVAGFIQKKTVPL